MNFLTFDHLFTGLAVAALGGSALAVAAHATPAETTGPGALDRTFTQADYVAFTRNFQTAAGECSVGFSERGLCFEASHLEGRIVEGEPFPSDMYPLALEWRASLALPRKSEDLKTARIGQTLVLMDRETRLVVDTMRLGETDFASATGQMAG